MPDESPAPVHLEITDTLVRLYVLLAQHLDRCQDEALRQSVPEREFQQHLVDTRDKVLQLLSRNRVVKEKVELEYDRVHALGTTWVEGRTDQTAKATMEQEREMLKTKILALSDLLAVFRAT